MKLKAHLLAALALAAFPVAAVAQFSDRFDTIDPAWVTNRYEPAGFAAVIFDGDSRLCLTIDQTGSTANRPTTFSSPFYNSQGRERAAGITGRWTLSAQVYISSAFNTTTGPLACSELWGHTGTTDGGGDYMIIDFTNESPTDTLNPTATDRAFRFRAYDGNTGNWFNLGVPAGFVFDAWHTLSGTSTGTAFEFRIDGVLVLTNSTVAGDDLQSAMIQGYNFGQAGSYSVYWDNVIAGVPVSPVITNNPLTAAGTVGTPFSFAITASGLPTSYTASPLPAGLSMVAATGVITGTPTAAGTTTVLLGATNAIGTSTASLTITIVVVPASRIVAFSARALSGPGDQTLIVGFAVSGDNKSLLVRGVGPTLASYGIVNFLTDPMLTLYGANNAALATNDNWQTDSSGLDQTTLMAATAARVGAFALPNGSKDSALLFTVNPGVYTTSLLRPNSTTGVALTEIYDTDTAPGARLTAVSARMNVTLGEGALIAGFSIAGSAPKTMLIRGVGPGLTAFGVSGVLADPQIAVYSGSTQIASNDNWETGTSTAAQIGAASAQVGEFPLAAGSKDAALLVTLQPGTYSVVVTGVGNTTGVALVEVYDTQ